MNKLQHIKNIIGSGIEQYAVDQQYYSLYKTIKLFDHEYMYSDNLNTYNHWSGIENQIFIQINAMGDNDKRESFTKLMSISKKTRDMEFQHYELQDLLGYRFVEHGFNNITKKDLDMLETINNISNLECGEVYCHELQLAWLPGVDSHVIRRKHRNNVFKLTNERCAEFISLPDELTISIVEWILKMVDPLHVLMLNAPWLVENFGDITPVDPGVDGYEGVVRLNIDGYNNRIAIPLITHLRSINYIHVDKLKDLLWP